MIIMGFNPGLAILPGFYPLYPDFILPGFYPTPALPYPSYSRILPHITRILPRFEGIYPARFGFTPFYPKFYLNRPI